MQLFKSKELTIYLQAFGSDEGFEKTYKLIPSDSVSENKLLFKEVSENIDKVLIANSYRHKQNTAVFTINVDYAVNEVTKQETMTSFLTIGIQDKTYYEYSLKLTAYTNNNETWRVEVSCIAGINDLRIISPYLIASTGNWIGKDSKHQLQLKMNIKDDFDVDFSLKLQKEYDVLC
jgi:hypothetical protein